ncbi:MAG: hypothetical protein JKY65_09660, partial [Planctomycetes bacterium]|nr:hypothetical protein [Planctomycetota bacterium]
MAKKKDKKKKGLFGLFGKDKDAGSTPPNQADDGNLGAGEMTMAPGYSHTQPDSPGDVGVVSFGNSPGAAAAEMTMAPGYADGGGLGNQADYAPPGGAADPFGDPPAGAASGGADPFGTADPFGADLGGGAAQGGGAADPFGADLGGGAPAGGAADPFGDADAADPFGGDLGGAPDPLGAATPGGISGPDATAETFALTGGSGAGEDPFGGMNPAEMTMVPDYAGSGGLGSQADWAKPGADAAPADAAPVDVAPAGAIPAEMADPFGDDFVAGEMTMAPGYAGSGAGAPAGGDLADPFGDPSAPATPAAAGPADPFGDLGLPATVGAADPFGDLGTPAAVGAPDPFGGDLGATPPPSEPDPFGAGEMTMAPNYTGASAPAGPAPAGDMVDPFGGPDPFGGDLGPPTPAEAAALGGGADPNDPFGPALLNQPVAGAAQPDGEGVSEQERTSVDLAGDIGDLEALRPTGTDVLQIGEVGAEETSLGPGTRDLFASFHQDGAEGVGTGLDESATHDLARCLIYAPPTDGGWKAVAGLRRLSDGAIVGAVRVTESGEFRWSIRLPATVEDGVLRVPLPASAQHDPETGALRVPKEDAGRLDWQPARFWRDGEGGLCFFVPKGATVTEGRLEIPQESSAPSADVAPDPDAPHGACLHERSYLGLTERSFADGWTSIALGSGAELSADGIELDPAAPGTRPALLEVETLASGRLRIALPSGAKQEGDLIWLGPIGTEDVPDEALFTVEAPIREVRFYLGIRDELLDNGWVRLVLPASASVVEGTLVSSADASGEPGSLRGSFDLTASGELSFPLPAGSEVLGNVIMIPPGGEEQATDTWASRGAGIKSEPDTGPRRWSMARDAATPEPDAAAEPAAAADS